MKKLILLSFAFFVLFTIQAQNEFITVWNTETVGTGTTPNNQVTIPIVAANYSVVWEEYATGIGITPTQTLDANNFNIYTFSSPGIYRAKITAINDFALTHNLSGDARKLLFVEQWGTNKWTGMRYAFVNCINMDITATDSPDLSGVYSMQGMFQNCSKLVGDASIENWNTTTNTSLNDAFNGALKFNHSLGNWNVTNVVGMARMLQGSGMDCVNYDKTLIGWAAQNVKSNIALGATGRVYSNSAAVAARATLVGKGWTITGDSHDPACNPASSVEDVMNKMNLRMDGNKIILGNISYNDILNVSDISGRLITSKIADNSDEVVFTMKRQGIYIISNLSNNQHVKVLVQ